MSLSGASFISLMAAGVIHGGVVRAAAHRPADRALRRPTPRRSGRVLPETAIRSAAADLDPGARRRLPRRIANEIRPFARLGTPIQTQLDRIW